MDLTRDSLTVAPELLGTRLRVGAVAANIVGVQPEISVAASLDRKNPTVDLGQIMLKPTPRIAAGN